MLYNLWGDLLYAGRRLRSSPGFTFAAIATIALGIGINTGIFSVLNGFALRELPATDAHELVNIHQVIEGEGVPRFVMGARSMFSTAEYRAYRDATQSLDGIIGYSRPVAVTIGSAAPQEARGALVTCNYFEVLRQPPVLGRGFSPGQCEDGSDPTVVLGHELWTTAFGADPTIVGRQIPLNRQLFTVVGIAAEGVRGVDAQQVSYFVPIAAQPALRPDWNVYRETSASWLTLVGRRNGAISLEQIRAELGVIAARIDAEQPPRRTTLVVVRARPRSQPETSQALLAGGSVVLAAFGLVLLLACANVANLLLARATGRAHEIAVRFSLGASRARVVQQLLAESIVLAVSGGLFGSLLAVWSFQGLITFALSAMQGSEFSIDTSPDLRVLAYAFALTLVTGLIFGLAPALKMSRPELHTAAKVGAASAAPRGGRRLQGVLLGLQVAVCMALMIGAGLLLRGLGATHAVEPGFAFENVVVASVNLGGAGYDAPAATTFNGRLLERVASLPGVEAVAQAATTPLGENDFGLSARLPGQDRFSRMGFNTVSPDYFSVLGIPIVQGRTFTAAELADGSTAAIVTESTARRYWPGRDPLGETIVRWGGGNQPDRELQVVGVAADAQVARIGEVPSTYVYLPATPAQQPALRLIAKSSGAFGTAAAAIRAATAEIDPLLVARVEPLEANLDIWQGLARVVSALSGSLGALALILSAVGIYGVVAYAVGSRVREIGIRLALGANARDVLSLILRRTMRPVAVGAFVGVAAAVVVSRVLSSVLFGVSPVDPIGVGGAALFVCAMALAAGVLAARPATRSDPMVALRYE